MKIYHPKGVKFSVMVSTTIVVARNRLGLIDNSKVLAGSFKTGGRGCPMLMGRKTFEQTPNLLPDHKYIVLTSGWEEPSVTLPDNVTVVNSFDEAFQHLADDLADAVIKQDSKRLRYYSKQFYNVADILAMFNEYCIVAGERTPEDEGRFFNIELKIRGGRSVFEQALQFADKMQITEHNSEGDGDVYFPDIPHEWWMYEATEKHKDETVTVWRANRN